MRRYISLLLALLLALSLAGCSGYTKEDLNEARRESHQAGYEMGYEAGLRDAKADYSEGYAKGYNAARSLYTAESSGWDSFEEYYSLLKEANAAGYETVSEYNAATSNKTSSSGLNQQFITEYNQVLNSADASGVDRATAAREFLDEYSYSSSTSNKDILTNRYYSLLPDDSNYDSIFSYGTDADSILDYIRDNPHDFNLYTEGDMCDAHEAGANGEDWFVR